MKKLVGIESARGLAALLVVLVHATSMLKGEQYLGALPLDGLFKFGHAGVDFFFVLSGFIIYFIHGTELGDRRYFLGFWSKRFIRIFPIYWVVLAGYAVLLVISPTRDRYEQDIVAVATSILLIPQAHEPILGVAWSLSHELLFYALFSVSFFSKLIGRAVMLLWCMLIAVNLATDWFHGGLWGSFAFRIFNAEFFFGLLVAHLIRTSRMRFPGTIGVAGTVLFFSAGVYESWGPGVPIEWPPLHLAYATGAAAMLYGLVGLENAGRLRMPGFALAMGEASYSIYLLHVIIIMLFQQLIVLARKFTSLPVIPSFLVVVVLTVAVSMVFSRRVEQPLMRAARKANKRLFQSVPKSAAHQ